MMPLVLPSLRSRPLDQSQVAPTDAELETRNSSINAGLSLLLPVQLVAAAAVGTAIVKNASVLPVALAIITLGWSYLSALLAAFRSPTPSWEHRGDTEVFLRQQAGYMRAKEHLRRHAVGALLPAIPLVAWCAASGFAS